MNINIGTKIKELRMAKKVTQAELAERIGVSTSAVSSYEVNERQPSYDVLIKIAGFFNVTTDYLLGLAGKDTIDITGLKPQQRNIVDEMIVSFKMNNTNEEIEVIRVKNPLRVNNGDTNAISDMMATLSNQLSSLQQILHEQNEQK